MKIRHELIGVNIQIINSNNPTLKGITGKIIDETQNTIKVQTKNSIKKMIKNQIIIKLYLGEKEIIIEGKELIGRPHERTIKK